MAAKKTAKPEKATPVNSAQEEKLKALEHALSDLDKQFGKGAVMKLGDRAEQSVQVIPTGCLTLDAALGVGGIPRGRIVEIYGPESSGRPPWRCTSSPRPRRPAASLPSWTRSMLWTPSTPRSWA